VTEAEVVRIMREHLEGQFPKVCLHCNRQFVTFRDYPLATEHLGEPIPYDAEMGNWNPLRPLGTLAFANCPCGTTLALTSEGMPLPTLWSLLNWAKGETKRRRMSPRELLTYLRDEICKQVLAGPG
jgi:hypothetical protein